MARRLVGWALVVLGVVLAWSWMGASTEVHLLVPGVGPIPGRFHSEALAHERLTWLLIGGLMTVVGVVMLATAPRADDKTRGRIGLVVLALGLVAAALISNPIFGVVALALLVVVGIFSRRHSSDSSSSSST